VSAAAPAGTWTGSRRTRSGGSRVEEGERLLLADAQTSGGLLIAGEMPDAAVIGELVADVGAALIVG
jgi:selenide,water dikinase